MSKKDYDINYQKLNCKQIKILLHKEIDKDIIEYLQTKKPMQTYLKDLIRREIKKEAEQ